MNILFIIDTLNVGGAEKSLLEIVSKFENYKPIICSVYKGNTLKKNYEDLGIKVYSLDLIGRFDYKRAVNCVINIIDNEKIKLIHSTLYRSDIISRKVKKLKNIPIVNSLVNNCYSRERYNKLKLFNKFKLFYYQFRDRYSSRNVDLFISNSKTIQISNARSLGIDLKKIIIIHRGRDFEKYSNAINNNDKFTLDLNFMKSKKVILSVSRLIERKGQIDLVNAFNLLKPIHRNNSILLIAGEGPCRDKLISLIKKYNLINSIFLLGNVENINSLLSLSTCFVFPSYYEGLPGALIEAMMAGKIIIASDIPENRECVDETSAIFFKSGNTSELCERLDQVLEHPEKYSDLGIKAQKISKDRFDINHIASEYEKIYDMILYAK